MSDMLPKLKPEILLLDDFVGDMYLGYPYVTNLALIDSLRELLMDGEAFLPCIPLLLIKVF